MRLSALAFLLGVLVFHSLPDVPVRSWVWALPALLAISARLPALRLGGIAAAGFLWTLLWMPPLGSQLPEDWQGVDLTVEGWIASIPAGLSRNSRFLFEVRRLSYADSIVPLYGKLRLSWYATPPPIPRVGDRWRFTVRLKRPRGFANPGGYDFERWLFAQGIAATGYVRPAPEPMLLGSAERYPIDRFRQRLSERFRRALTEHRQAGILAALAVGDRQGIEAWQWQVFRRTGTSHLMAISGLHIGMVAALAWFLGRHAWSWFPPLVRCWPAQKAAAVVALSAAFGYALLAGFALPTQRALVMLAVALLALLLQRNPVPSRILCLALWAVLILDPYAPLSVGFWLSFGAVGAILYVLVGHRRPPRPLWHWFALQLFVLIALTPATLIFFQTTTLLAPLANLIAIPWVGATVVPLTLLAIVSGALSESLQNGVLQASALAMEWLWRFLEWLAQFDAAVLQQPAPPLWTLLFALPGIALLLAPRGLPARWLGIVLCLPLLFFPRPLLPKGSAYFTVLDVGRGLAVVVETREHVLVYDTGPRLGANFDAARAALIPYLRQRGIRRIDKLIISHADSAHTGGVRSLLEAFPVGRVAVTSPAAVPVNGAVRCASVGAWVWDDVNFALLHPPNTACVLQIVAQDTRVLLGGDLEPSAQRRLLEHHASRLAAEILLPPRHGRGEILPDLLGAVRPRYALLSTAYANRGDHPRAQLVQALSARGITVLNTARDGAIGFRLGAGRDLSPQAYRQRRRHYWHTP